MESYKEIIQNAHKELSKQLMDLIENCKEYTIETKNGSSDDKILDVLCNNKKILTATYEILGTYDSQFNLFFWAKNIKLVDKQITKISKNVKKYSSKIKEMIIEKRYKDVDYLERLYYYTNNGIFFIFPDNVNDIIEFSTYVSKCKGILKQQNNLVQNGKIVYTYYIITDILGT